MNELRQLGISLEPTQAEVAHERVVERLEDRHMRYDLGINPRELSKEEWEAEQEKKAKRKKPKRPPRRPGPKADGSPRKARVAQAQ